LSPTNACKFIFPEGHEYGGKQAIILEPSKPFPLMKLSTEVRLMVWQYVLAPCGHLEGKITISNASAGKSGVFAKDYNEGMKGNRLSCLLVNKEVGLPTHS